MPHSRPQVILVYRRLLSYVAPHWKVLPIALVAMVVAAGSNGVVPYLMSEVVEVLESEGRGAGSLLVPLLLFVTFMVRATVDFIAVYGLGWLGRSVVRDLRAQIFERYTELPISYFEHHSSGALVSKLNCAPKCAHEAGRFGRVQPSVGLDAPFGGGPFGQAVTPRRHNAHGAVDLHTRSKRPATYRPGRLWKCRRRRAAVTAADSTARRPAAAALGTATGLPTGAGPSS